MAFTASAVNYIESPLISGWNLLVTNNGGAFVGGTNNEFTEYSGQIVYSLTNNAAGSNTNSAGYPNIIWPDAFVNLGITLKPDMNADYNANAAVHYYLDNTNWIPQTFTNSYGQTVVTNSWVLLPSSNPTYFPPGTTNLYSRSLLENQRTNIVNFYLQRGWKYPIGGNSIYVWDQTNVWSFAVAETNAATGNPTPIAGVTNLPTTFTQGADVFRLYAVTLSPSADSVASSNDAVLINVISIGQPQP